MSGRPESLKIIHSNGGSVSSQDSKGAFPIHYAALECHEPLDEGTYNYTYNNYTYIRPYFFKTSHIITYVHVHVHACQVAVF